MRPLYPFKDTTSPADTGRGENLRQGRNMASNENNVQGDGNVIGQGNTVSVFINKPQNTVHHHHGGSGGGGGGGRGGASGGDQRPAILGLASIGIFAMCFAAFQFSRHAPQFYGVAVVVAALLGLLGLGLTLWHAWEEMPWGTCSHPSFVAILSAGFLICTVGAWREHPQELLRIANQTTSAKQFWCSLNDLGHLLALKHLFGYIAIALGLLLLVPHAFRALGRHALESTSSMWRLFAKIAPVWTGVLALALVGLGWFVTVADPADYLGDLVRGANFLMCPASRN
jgi:hypothetical protein